MRLALLAAVVGFVIGGALEPSAQSTSVRIGGAVARPMTLTADDLKDMPRQTATVSAHSQVGTYEGVAVRELLTRAGVPTGQEFRGAVLAQAVIVTGLDGYKVAFGIAELDPATSGRTAFLADRKDGAPLGDNAGPLQLIVPGDVRPARWVRQVVSIDVVPGPR